MALVRIIRLLCLPPWPRQRRCKNAQASQVADFSAPPSSASHVYAYHPYYCGHPYHYSPGPFVLP
jgi:hypothetical protein